MRGRVGRLLRGSWRAAALLLLVGSSGARLAASGGDDESGCPWCGGDAERMRALGVVSHGPFGIARTDTERLPRETGGLRWVFVETPHLRLASSLPELALDRKERKRRAEEIEWLRGVLEEDLPRNVTRLDPWLRAHLLARHAERTYARFQEICRVTDDSFPERRQREGAFRGLGKYLGESDKYEIVLHDREADHREFTQAQMGVQASGAVRWHFSPKHSLTLSLPASPPLDEDLWLQPHLTHHLAHLFLSGFEHFSYDPPVWLDAGLAHFMEREVHPLSFSLDSGEGTAVTIGSRADWDDEARKLVKREQATPWTRLLTLHTFGDPTLEDHKTSWSMVRFLATEHPEGFARFLAGVKGQLDERGVPSGKDLPSLQRRLVREIWGWTPGQLDEAWRAWVLR